MMRLIIFDLELGAICTIFFFFEGGMGLCLWEEEKMSMRIVLNLLIK